MWINIHISHEHASHSAEPNMYPLAALATMHPLYKHKGSGMLQLFGGHTGTNTARHIIGFSIRIRVAEPHTDVGFAVGMGQLLVPLYF